MQDQCACGCGKISPDDKRFTELKAYIDSMAGEQGITIMVLQEAQRLFGYLPLEVQKFVSEQIGVPLSEIYGVVTFYSQFNTSPEGRHRIGICLGTACYVRGAQAVMDKVCEVLGIHPGETTPDGMFALETTRCLGCCSLAPVMMIDDDIYGRLDDLSRIPAILDTYRE